MLFGIAAESALAATSLDEAMTKVHLYPKGMGTQLLVWNTIIADDFTPKMIMYRADDGAEYPAYCLQPNRDGVNSGFEYDVGVDDALSGPQVWGAIANGYPFKTPAELGLATEYQAYYATKMAIWALVHYLYADIDKWTANGTQNEPVLAAMKAIYNAGKSTTSIPQNGGSVTATPNVPVARLDSIDENYYSQTFTVSPSAAYTVALGAGAPVGSKITDEQNNAKTDFQSGEKFKVLVPVTGPESGGSFSLNLTAKGSADAILWGHSYNEDTQDYAVVAKGLSQDSQATATYARDPGETPPPSDPPSSDPQYGGLKILKYDNATGKLIAGALFEVRGIDETNHTILFQVKASAGAALPGVEDGVIIETSDRQISVRGLPLGKYQITELSPPPNYDVSPDEPNPKIVEVQAASEATVYPQVAFRNNPFGRLRIAKIDAVTGKPVARVWLRIRNPITGFDVTRKTDNSGIIELGDLPQGNYEVSEVNSGSDYELSDKVLVVPVRWGQLSEVTFDNEPHTTVELMKNKLKN
jgi:hypothetical protein